MYFDKYICFWNKNYRFFSFLRMCFLKLKLLLVAIEARSEDGSESCIAINPGSNIKIENNTQGFFIAQSADEVKR